MSVRIVAHPLAGHLLAELRDRQTAPDAFRRVARRLATLLVLEATASLRTQAGTVETPLASAPAARLDQPLAVVPILRAGLGLLEPIVEMFPDVRVGAIGLARDEATSIAHGYYEKLPDLRGSLTLCLDPMLATGGSACDAINRIKAQGPARVVMVAVVAAPEGVARLTEAHPDVEVVTAAVDAHLNERNYIVPGLGDFGDRLFGT
jgi:uracil phosphoribosyltransferase